MQAIVWAREDNLRVDVPDAINDEHAASLAAHELTAQGYGDSYGPIVIDIRPEGGYTLYYRYEEPSHEH